MNSNNSFQNQLVEAHSLIQQGRHNEALVTLNSVQEKIPRNADAIHLIALAYKGIGDVEQALKYFQRSLDLNERQPQVYNNLANLQKVNSDFANAEKNYFRAIALHSTYLEAHRNLALCYAAQDKSLEVIEAASKALEIEPNDITSLTLIADAYRYLNDYDRAHDYYQNALALDSRDVSAWQNLGVNHHLQQELELARKCYQKAYELSPSTPQVVQSLALVSSELGLSHIAIDIFETYLEEYSDDVDMHERFNQMLWETDFQGKFGDSYKRAIKRSPMLDSLRSSYISQLFKAGQLGAAKNVLKESVELIGYSPTLLSLEGEMLAEQMQYPKAVSSLVRSIELEFCQHTAQQLVKLNIIEGHYSGAQTYLNELIKRFPECQLSWAYQGLVWRLTKDERYSWLMNYDEFVKPFTLGTPDGYSNLSEFLISLDAVLGDLHRMKNAPLQQTLRNGTQTSARLLHNPIHECVLLKEELTKVVRRYISELPNDQSHPFLKRKSNNFGFSGSWSVKLRPEGFHVNHVHPQGWISSSFYVSIPEGMMANSQTPYGQIKFGESPLQLKERELIEKVIRPQPGMVVLFPSYCWHGTIPFPGGKTDYRMTAPFDIEPL